jgi:hypothetical protein
MILSGGTAKMIGMVGFFEDMLEGSEFSEIKVKLGDPFRNIEYPPVLEEKINKSSLFSQLL